MLDNVMQECTRQNIGVVKKQAQVITYEFDEKMWYEGVLGEHTPDILRQTVLYLLGINCFFFYAVEEHHNLWRDMPNEPSQFSFERNKFGNKCVVYREDYVTKAHGGGSMI